MHERLLTSKEVAEVLGLSEASIFRFTRENKPGWPRPIRSGTRYTRWRQTEVMAWIDSLTPAPVARPAPWV